jgi:hypothetical protein
MKHLFIKGTVAVIGVILFLYFWWGIAEGPFRNPDEALKDFYNAQDRAEDQIIDPLILAGNDVVPLVINELSNKEMRLRRYAIALLGNGRYGNGVTP